MRLEFKQIICYIEKVLIREVSEGRKFPHSFYGKKLL